MKFMRTLLMSCALFICVQASAQDWSGKVYQIYEIYQGYIIGNNSDTTYGFVMHGNRADNQTSVSFYTDAKDPKTKKVYKPADLKGYMVADKVYRTINYSGGLSSKKQEFVLEVKPGRIAQMVYYLSNSGAEADEQMVWYREGENPIQHKDFILGYAKKMSKLVSDYPELAKKVEDKEKGYGLGRVFQVIEEYNKWWAAKTSN